MRRLLPLFAVLAAASAPGAQTKWIYRNPSTGGGTLVDDADESHALRNVRLVEAGSTAIRIHGGNGASGDCDLFLPVVGEDGTTSYTVVGFADGCFQDNQSIRSIVFPPGLEAIPAKCFQSCGKLTNAPLPSTLVSIGSGSFSGCSSLVGDIVLPDAVEEINNVWRNTKITSFTAGAGLLSIGASSFQDMSSITNVDLSPAVSLRSIGDKCFQSAGNVACDLSGAGLPRTVERIGSSAFYGCPKVTGDVVLPDAVSFVTNTFRGTKLTAFVAGAGLLSIGNDAFKDMAALRHLDLSAPTNLAYVGSSCFASCSGITNDLAMPERGMLVIGAQAFRDCRGMGGDVVLPETVTNLPAQVFANTGIRSVEAKGVRSIGDQCFKNAASLARIELGWSLDALLGSECLNGASALRAVFWRSPPDPAKCTGDAPMGAWDWRANGCTNYIPWNPRTRTAAQPWADFAADYNANRGLFEMPAQRYGVGVLKREGRSAAEYVAYWVPDPAPATVLMMR